MEALLFFLSNYNAFGLALLVILVPSLKILMKGENKTFYTKIARLLEENDLFENNTARAITGTLGIYKRGFFTEPGVASKYYLMILPLLIVLAVCLYYVMYKFVAVTIVSDMMKQYIAGAIVATPYGKFTKPVIAIVILTVVGLCIASL